ncbi:MAG: glycerophosphodiester phosphodiesterase [Gemmatimonadota bacterium]|nr:glycerophosphodiester phosphodiesterase [Gemmatimonadota bacterium]
MNPLTDLAGRPIIAHRGASGGAPENTRPAFDLAVRQGADAIELDVRLTADGVAVVLHDATLDRTTGGHGPVRALSLAELREVDAGARFTLDGGRTFPFRAADVRIPTLSEVLRRFPQMPLLLDLKEPSVQEAVRLVLVEESAVERCVLASEHHAVLQAFHQPPFTVAASGSEVGALFRAVLLRRVPASVSYRTLSVPMRYRGVPVPTRGFVAAARGLGCPVHVWTVNDAATARTLWGRGVAGMVTNYPASILEAREK